jgi:hypothetical protein
VSGTLMIGDHAYVGVTPTGRARLGVQTYRVTFVRIRRLDRTLGGLLALYALWCALTTATNRKER